MINVCKTVTFPPRSYETTGKVTEESVFDSKESQEALPQYTDTRYGAHSSSYCRVGALLAGVTRV
jgi:hypothetical protein